MMIPGVILDVFAAIMLAVAAVSTARLVAARASRREDPEGDIDVAHVLMGIAMAGMLTASLTTLPSAPWAVIFGLMTAWFGYRVTREARGRGPRSVVSSHHSPHLVHSAAMLYMFVALAPAAANGGQGMTGMGGPAGQAMRTLSLPAVALVFVFVLAGYAVWDLDRISGPAAHGAYRLAGPALAHPAGALAGAASGAEPPAVAFTGPVAARGRLAAAAQSPPGGRRRAASGGGAPGIGPGTVPRRLVLAPGLVTGCRIAMGVTMAFMLAIMI
ncbi:MAG TPA: DUF5134 domain-containing protein [Streptosporangiaceae bacterium]|jgi:hypothetical protein